MNKVLMTHSFFYRLDAKQWSAHQPYPPLGTLFAASLLRENGNDVSFFDSNFKTSPHQLLDVLKKEQPDYVVIYDDGFNYLTKMCLTTMREASFTMIELAKGFGCRIIVSSSDASDHYQEYIDHGADYVMLGEGEVTLLELISELSKPLPEPETVNGLAYWSTGTVKLTEKRQVLRDLDILPLPAWDLIEMEEYRQVWMEHHGYFSLNIATTRGCPFKCNWCAKPIYGNRYNSRSPENVVAEIKLLLEKYQPDHFWFCDDIFGLKPGLVNRFQELVKENRLSFRYKIQSRVDLLLQEDTIDALVNSGVDTVWVGAESGSQKILDAMDKGITVEQIYQATRLLKRKGVKVGFFLQFGYLGETREDIDSTLDMILELMPDEIGISVSYPLPGTPFFENVKDMLREKQNWTDSDDLAMMFHNTFPPGYYKTLHRYVHNRYRMRRGINQLKGIFHKPQINKGSLYNLASMVYNTPFSVLNAYKLKKLSNV